MSDKTSKEIVFEAVQELYAQEQIVTRETLAELLEMKLSIIDGSLKTLSNDGEIIRVQRGVYIPASTHPEARPVSHTELPDGTVIIDIGDSVFKLTPKEARMLGTMLSGRALQATQIDSGRQTSVLSAELSKRLSVLERIADRLLTTDDLSPL